MMVSFRYIQVNQMLIHTHGSHLNSAVASKLLAVTSAVKGRYIVVVKMVHNTEFFKLTRKYVPCTVFSKLDAIAKGEFD